MAHKKDNVVLGANEEYQRKKGHNILPKIISVLLAFILWFYVMTVESPIHQETFKGIPVEVTLPTNGELSLYSGYNAMVDVTVKGKKSDLNQISETDFKATADASAYTQAGKYSIPVNIEIPGGFTLVDKSISLLSVYLDAKATTSVPVKVELTGFVLSEGLELGGDNEIEKSASEVFLAGPKSVLDTIETARVTIPCGNVKSSLRAKGNVVLYDANGSAVSNPYVTMGITTVDVKIPVFMTKDIDLKVGFEHGYLNSGNCKITLSDPTVKVRGAVETVESLDEYVFHTIDEKALTSNKLSVPLELPEGVSCVDPVETVYIAINHVGTSTKTLTVTNINVNNPDGLEYTLSLSKVNVTLRGNSAELAEITPGDIVLNVDISGLNADSGTGGVTRPIKVEITDKNAKSVYELGEYNVVVTVK